MCHRLFLLHTGLQAELSATQIDDEYVRKKLKLVEDEKDDLRQRYNEWEDDFKRKHGIVKPKCCLLNFIFNSYYGL